MQDNFVKMLQPLCGRKCIGNRGHPACHLCCTLCCKVSRNKSSLVVILVHYPCLTITSMSRWKNLLKRLRHPVHFLFILFFILNGKGNKIPPSSIPTHHAPKSSLNVKVLFLQTHYEPWNLRTLHFSIIKFSAVLKALSLSLPFAFSNARQALTENSTWPLFIS